MSNQLLIYSKHRRERTNLICLMCGKKFTQIAHLNVHMDWHSGTFKYKCQYCEYATSTKSSYQSHMDSHMRQRGKEANPGSEHLEGKKP